ncbi:MAG TPA: AmmeMemoRadiSam system radical SAM enzyme [Feifaniaceae bacterium]|nr:AmmeMemoRadiSam system radical SAM enzyme [Feifaniaceae bacterium]
MKQTCTICPRRCILEEGQTGFCRARENRGGKVVCGNYARVTALSLDPIEKKPLKRFHPGTRILSVGSYGCNLNCPFCQNSDISMANEKTADWRIVTPEELIDQAEQLKGAGNIGIAFTYNEPLIGYEYVFDCARLAKERGLKTVLVTNGYILPEPWLELLPVIDAANIDLKAFTEEGYRSLGGDLETVKTAITLAAERIHVEVTSLIVPGLNDDESEMRAEAKWLKALPGGVALHLSRYFPMYRQRDGAPTPLGTIDRLTEIARQYVPNVYRGNC